MSEFHQSKDLKIFNHLNLTLRILVFIIKVFEIIPILLLNNIHFHYFITKVILNLIVSFIFNFDNFTLNSNQNMLIQLHIHLQILFHSILLM